MERGATQGPAAGWYDDPGGSGSLRYWSGSQWGTEIRPAGDPNGTSPEPPDEPAPEPTPPTARVLDLLRLQGGRSMAGLARETGLATSEVTRLTDRLLSEGRIAVHGDVMKRYFLPDDPTSLHLQRERAAAVPDRPALAAAHPSTVRATQTITDAHGNVYRASAPPAPMTFGEAVSEGWRNGLTFEGRAGRPEYWWFALFAGLVLVVAQFLPLPLFLIASLVVGVPHLAVGTRRLHDTDRSGAWLLWAIAVPLGFQLLSTMAASGGAWVAAIRLGFLGALLGLIAGVVMLVLLVQPGSAGANRYGDMPTGTGPTTTGGTGSAWVGDQRSGRGS
jgi:uncharacterized membrane protein YhaH (DUF805 family)